MSRHPYSFVLEMLLFIRFCFGSVLFLLVFVLENCLTFFCPNLDISQHPEYSFLVFSSFLKQFFIPSFPIIQKVQFSKSILAFPSIQKRFSPQHFSTSRECNFLVFLYHFPTSENAFYTRFY